MNFGSVEESGYTWAATVAKQQWAVSTRLHVVGDGADWISRQSRACLGAGYLVDFYHFCEYLAAAAQKAATYPGWLSAQKKRLKNNRGGGYRIIGEVVDEVYEMVSDYKHLIQRIRFSTGISWDESEFGYRTGYYTWDAGYKRITWGHS